MADLVFDVKVEIQLTAEGDTVGLFSSFLGLKLGLPFMLFTIADWFNGIVEVQLIAESAEGYMGW